MALVFSILACAAHLILAYMGFVMGECRRNQLFYPADCLRRNVYVILFHTGYIKTNLALCRYARIDRRSRRV